MGINFNTEFSRLQMAIFSPGKFFRSEDKDGAFYRSLRLYVLLSVIALVVILIVTVINLAKLEAMFAGLNALMPESTIPQTPWNNLLFPVTILVSILWLGLFRHIFVSILNIEGSNIARSQTIQIYAMIPLLLLGTLLTVINSFFPTMPGPEMFSGGEVLKSGLFFMFAFGWEAYISISGYRNWYRQDLGRAIITWFSPLALCSVIGICGIVVLFMYNLAIVTA